MAKIDSQASRLTVFADDDPPEQFYRPAPASEPRTKVPQDISSKRSASRRPIEMPAPDADAEEDVFLRARRRVPVRRGLIPSSRTGRIVLAIAACAAFVLVILVSVAIRNFFRDDPRFRISSTAAIQIMGNGQVTRPELLAVFGSDLGRNIFYIPMTQRRAALEALPWVEHATVMRLLPDQMRVSIVERTPIAFVRLANSIGLIDVHGVVLHLGAAAMAAKHYSFPVVTGINVNEPLAARAAKMQRYQQFVQDLDAGDHKISPQLSEVDLSDPEDVWALLPAQGNDIQVHFGDTDYLARYHSYQQHLPEWQQQYPHLASVDMRYDNQVVLDMNQQQAATPDVREAAPAAAPHHTQPAAEKHATHAAAKTAKATKPKPTKPLKTAKAKA